jgi:hypothetical protein
MLKFDDSATRTGSHLCDYDPTSSADLDWVEIIREEIKRMNAGRSDRSKRFEITIKKRKAGCNSLYVHQRWV